MPVEPPELAWVRSRLGPDATLGPPLGGGVTSQVWLVAAGGKRAVLKQVTNPDWLAERPDVVGYEARVLDHLASTAVAVPRVLALDEDGVEAGHPSMLLAHIDAPPAGDTGRPSDWLAALADTAAAISRIEPPSWVRPFSRYLEPGDAEPPAWAADSGLWAEAIAIVSRPAPATPDRLIHRDYHPWNVLWDGAIAGVVDWSQTSIGPVAVDSSHCRANLAIRFGNHVADDFGRHWEQATGLEHDTYWDLVTCVDFLPDWHPSPRGNSGLEGFIGHVLGGA